MVYDTIGSLSQDPQISQNNNPNHDIFAFQLRNSKQRDERDDVMIIQQHHREDHIIDVPEDYGIMLELRTSRAFGELDCDPDNPQNGDVQVILHSAVPNQHYGHIHPHCHGPANMQDVRPLHGGGSGAAVFHGRLDIDGAKSESIIMKHGGPKEASEVFALVTICQELQSRAQRSQSLTSEAHAAAKRLQQKIPEFVMVYISPYHLRNRYQELWTSLFRPSVVEYTHNSSSNELNMLSHSLLASTLAGHLPHRRMSTNNGVGNTKIRHLSIPKSPSVVMLHSGGQDSNLLNGRLRIRLSKSFADLQHQTWKTNQDVVEAKLRRNIRVRFSRVSTQEHKQPRKLFHISQDTVEILLPSRSIPFEEDFNDHSIKKNRFLVENGMDGLQRFAAALRQELTTQQWKVTLGQKPIGGPDPKNGADILTSGYLTVNQKDRNQNGSLLEKLVIEYCQVIEDLSQLTYPHERRGDRMDFILQEVNQIKAMYYTGKHQREAITTSFIESQYHDKNDLDWDELLPFVTENLDLYVGSAIRKNFEPVTGRFAVLRQYAIDLHFDALLLDSSSRSSSTSTLCSQEQYDSEWDFEHSECLPASKCALKRPFSSENWVFTEEEETPARFLAVLLYKKELVTDFNPKYDHSDRGGISYVFADPPTTSCALDLMEERGWFDLLEHATSFAYDESISLEAKSAALDCIWTCGLTDTGLQNLFMQQERGLELFDLGEPRLEPRPAFLTKFLMSFFHTLGMEEEQETNDSRRAWVSRFSVIERDGRHLLGLTEKTKDMLPYVLSAFTFTLDYFIENMFRGSERVRTLLLKYVILQLLSDSSFCISRWEDQGGGTERYGDKLQQPLEKWLWRSLWDQYVACYVYSELLLPSETV